MSVRVTAIFGHSWERFSREIVQNIATAVSVNTNDLKFFPEPPFKTAEEDFAASGCVFCSLAHSYTLLFGSRTLILSSPDRWSRFLINVDCRQSFLRACRSISPLSRSSEILIIPGGTIIEDLYYDRAPFEEFKKAAARNWGSANIDIDHIYGENEVYRNNGKRVDYALVSASSPLVCNTFETKHTTTS